MIINSKRLRKGVKKVLIVLICTVIISGAYLLWQSRSQVATADIESPAFGLNPDKLVIIQENSLSPSSNPTDPPLEIAQRLNVVITAYSSTIQETDDTPYITAAGTTVRDGIIANNYFPLGTKIRIPELYGDKIFVVEDRMNWQKSNYHFDIWFSSYSDALNFGAKRTYIEILES